MPAGTQASPYDRLRSEAVKALQGIQREIRRRETELSELRQQEQKIQSVMGRPAKEAVPKGGPRSRIDWRAVLSRLPKQFTAADVRKVRGLAGKHSREIFAGITRWIDAKLVKRKERGVYERVG